MNNMNSICVIYVYLYIYIDMHVYIYDKFKRMDKQKTHRMLNLDINLLVTDNVSVHESVMI